jgi:hypothetical protein
MLLEAALEGLELHRQRIDEQIRQVRSLLGKRGSASSAARGADSATGAAPSKRRKLSSAARKRIAAAQKKRWADYRKNAAKP